MDDIVPKLGTIEDFSKILRRCGTKGEPNLFPYEGSEITIESVIIENLVPLSKYVLQENLEQVTLLQDRLKLEDIDIFDLPGRLTLRGDGDMRFISPPIVELWKNEGFLLVDGLHRVCLARQQGRDTINCAVIRGVTTPMVPLPTVWEKVRTYPPGEMPRADEKRDYRFPTATSLRDAMPAIRDKVTDENYRYFLFRDLGALGSTGIREAKSNRTTEGI